MDCLEISHNGNTAWVFVDGEMKVAGKTDGKQKFKVPYRFSAVLVKKGDRWVWRMFHGSNPSGE
jgi:ketosteroid isomerase-like protein